MVAINKPFKGSIDTKWIRQKLNENKHMKAFLAVCATCGLCKSGCFKYLNTNDVSYMPSHKSITTLGKLFKSNGNVTREELVEIGNIAFNKCALCRRCNCPFGIELSNMMALARTICRHNGVFERFDKSQETTNEDA